jgi:hypothetical protein
MKYTFHEVNSTYPKRTYRSKRTLKKLHLDDFSQTLFNVCLSIALFDSDKEYELLDAIYDFYNGVSVYGDTTSTTNILVEIDTNKFSPDYAMQYCDILLTKLSAIDGRFAELKNITIEYGDANYGEW